MFILHQLNISQVPAIETHRGSVIKTEKGRGEFLRVQHGAT